MGKRLGLWLTNGNAGHLTGVQLGWNPAAVTCFYDYLADNGVYQYKRDNPDVDVIIRFQHNHSWMNDWQKDAEDKAKEIALAKWPSIKELDPYVYYANENNLHYENGDPNLANQWQYETKEFYELYARWITLQAVIIKDLVPEMKLVTPPFAFGHNEDGEPVGGVPKLGWAGYDYLADTVHNYFDDTLTFHGYWGDGSGEHLDRLYDGELSAWYAYRWRKVLDLFEVTYNNPNCKMLIDECGNFEAGSETFTTQLTDYGTQCLQDSRVLAVTPFLFNDPTNSPGNVPNSWYQKMTPEQLSYHLVTLQLFEVGTEPPVEPPEPDCECQPIPGAIDVKVEVENARAAVDRIGVGMDKLKTNC